MKTYLLFALFLGIFTATAQEFKVSDAYTIANERLVDKEREGPALLDLVSAADPSTTKAVLEITELELLENIRISVLYDPNLEDLAEIVKVELEYLACCSSTDTYYFLVGQDKEFTALPRLQNLYCEHPQQDTHYIFPSEEFGQEGMILRARLNYTEKYKIKDIKVLQSYVWQDDDFGYEEAITAVNY